MHVSDIADLSALVEGGELPGGGGLVFPGRRMVALYRAVEGEYQAALERLAPVQRQVNDVEFGCLSHEEFALLTGIVDRLIDEPVGGAHTDRDTAMANVGDVLAEELKGFDGLTPQPANERLGAERRRPRARHPVRAARPTGRRHG